MNDVMTWDTADHSDDGTIVIMLMEQCWVCSWGRPKVCKFNSISGVEEGKGKLTIDKHFRA